MNIICLYLPLRPHSLPTSFPLPHSLGAFVGDRLASPEDTKAMYEAKTATYEENQKVRKEELEALGKAIEIISNPNVSDSYAEHVNAELIQAPKKVSLLQVHAASKRQALRNQAAEFLKARAADLNSKMLSSFAAKLTENNPFDKVITMIEDLLTKLKEEAASEADHKAFCDKELKKNKMKRDKKTAEVETLRAQIDQKTVEITDMAKKIKTLAEEQAALRKDVAEATKVRGEEKPENMFQRVLNECLLEISNIQPSPTLSSKTTANCNCCK